MGRRGVEESEVVSKRPLLLFVLSQSPHQRAAHNPPSFSQRGRCLRSSVLLLAAAAGLGLRLGRIEPLGLLKHSEEHAAADADPHHTRLPAAAGCERAASRGAGRASSRGAFAAERTDDLVRMQGNGCRSGSIACRWQQRAQQQQHAGSGSSHHGLEPTSGSSGRRSPQHGGRALLLHDLGSAVKHVLVLACSVKRSAGSGKSMAREPDSR